MADYNKPLPLTPGEIVRSMSTHHQQPSQRPSQPRVSDSHTTSVAARPTGVMNSLSHSQASRGAYPTTRASVPARHRFLPPWASGDQHAASTADPQKPTEHPSPRPFCLGTSTLEDPFIDPPALTPPPRPSAPVPFNLSASDAAGHRGTQAREFLNTSTLEDPFTDPPALTPPPRPSAPVPFDLSASDAASRRGTQTRAFLNTGFYGSQGTHPTAGLQPPPRPKLRRATLAFIPPPHSFVQIPVSHVASNASLRSPQAGTSPKTGHGRSQAATNFNGEVSADGSAVDDRWAPALPVSAAGIPGADHAAGVPEAQHAAGSTWSMKKIVSFEEPLESKEVNAETPDKQQHDNKTREGSMNKLRSHLKNSNFFPFSQPSIEEKVNAWMETVEPDAEVMPYQEDVNEAFGHDSEETDEGARLETEPVKDEPTSEMKEEEAEKGLTPEIQNSHEEMAPETEEHDPSPEPPPLVSLDPTNQARILSTLQLMLRTTASNFLVNEAGAGRLRPETIRGVQGEWAASGGRRPVLDFLYPTDLQVKLVTADRRRLIFGAPNFNNFDWLLEATLEQWLEIATHMDAWNYCSPDKEILAWIHGLTTVLTMLNAPEASLGELRAVAVWAVRVIAARKAAGLGRTL
ncbi:hypothetical protein A1O3_04780 [Capronia epimyces CBS 606.96]|uniref:Uncharacterized protein n=1 Tax=Capronia epimyces CBS 606.96 TaxID=1182542 RepID=W9XV49_9EURO|nr:uncharacterized protein A1O3_04780 [Capronia epimyces CBS 606.96]EXJ84113.1 hypothetical protein A1O3_04780 [Capronia epimyces CBS 606.96]